MVRFDEAAFELVIELGEVALKEANAQAEAEMVVLLDEAEVVAEAEVVVETSPLIPRSALPAVVLPGEGSLEALRAIFDEQARIAEVLSQAAEIVAQTQPHPQPLSWEERGARIHPTVPEGVARRAGEILAREPLFLDYETTGLKKTDAVVEVSVVDGQGRNVFHSWVNPQRFIPAQMSQTHGLTDQAVANAPTWAEIAPLLERRLRGRVVVAHNAKFEAKFTPAWEIEWACTKELADQAFGQAHWYEARLDWRRRGGLADRLRQCGLQPGPEHTAAGDCLSALRLLRYLAGYEQII